MRQSLGRRIDMPDDLRLATEFICELSPGVSKLQPETEESLDKDPTGELVR